MGLGMVTSLGTFFLRGPPGRGPSLLAAGETQLQGHRRHWTHRPEAVSHPVPHPRPVPTLPLKSQHTRCEDANPVSSKEHLWSMRHLFLTTCSKPLVQCGNSIPAAARTGGAEKRRGSQTSYSVDLAPWVQDLQHCIQHRQAELKRYAQRYLGRLHFSLSVLHCGSILHAVSPKQQGKTNAD